MVAIGIAALRLIETIAIRGSDRRAPMARSARRTAQSGREEKSVANAAGACFPLIPNVRRKLPR
jgi:hypothetical protein